MIKTKKIKTKLTKAYKLKEARIVHKDLASRKTTGSIIMRV